MKGWPSYLYLLVIKNGFKDHTHRKNDRKSDQDVKNLSSRRLEMAELRLLFADVKLTLNWETVKLKS